LSSIKTSIVKANNSATKTFKFTQFKANQDEALEINQKCA